MKTASEIRDEVKALTEIKPKVRRYTVFGDDNWAAIDRQIEALVDEWTDNDVRDLRDDLTEHEFQSAREAIDWANGDYDEYEEDGEIVDRPSLSWKSLVQ